MAQKVQVILTDDLDGGDADETVQFTLDGVSYEIDLSEANAEALREATAPYVTAARRVGGRSSSRSRPVAAPRSQNASAVRAWARENGWPDLSSRGRVSGEIKSAYEAAH